MSEKDRKHRIHTYLKQNHGGRKNAASSKTLEAVFHIKSVTVRKIVNSLRSDGVPICIDAGGYYYAASKAEIDATVAQLDNRIQKIAKARNGLDDFIDKEGNRWHENMS